MMDNSSQQKDTAQHTEGDTSARTYSVLHEAKPTTIVVYCSDPRFQSAFSDFIKNELHLEEGQYVPFVVGGGAGVLANPEKLPKEFKFIKDRLELFRQHYPSIKKVVLINHEDCAYYGMLREKLVNFLGSFGKNINEKSREDMVLIADIFSRLLSHLSGYSLELYYAKFTDETHSKVEFEKIKI
jgi:hypothetical protein